MSKHTALQCAVGLLARREHSEQELRQKLELREYSDESIEEAISRLHEKNYLCDERFAASVCRHRVNRGFGWLYISNELNQKGVCSTIIQQLQKNCEIDWYLQAVLAYNKRFGDAELSSRDTSESLNDPSNKEGMAHQAQAFADKVALKKEQDKIKAKKIRFLQARGFSIDETLHALNN